MSNTSVALARAMHEARLVEAEESRRASHAATARRLQRKAVRLSRKAQRVSRRAEWAATQARLGVAR